MNHIERLRIGNGWDIHRFVENRPLVLGGVTIPYHRGLAGHSDADAVVHAVIDALFGAAGLPDIGHFFPDTDPAYKDADSIRLLAEAGRQITRRGYCILYIDCVIFAQMPRMAPYRQRMIGRLCEALGIPDGRVNLKATTTEGLGFIGKGDGVAAHSVALLEYTPSEEV